MRYYSTKNHHHTATLEEAVMRGLAPDGGLYVPERLVSLPQAFVRNMASMSLQDIGYAIANFTMQTDMEADVLHEIVNQTLHFEIPLRRIDDNHFVLELFDGPSMAFKDVGARFLALLMRHFKERHPEWPDIHVLVPTSGDTGGAVACGFHDVPGVHVHVLYPQDQLSYVQEAQFASLGGNVTAIEVKGTFDDCKRLVDKAFGDKDLQAHLHLTSATTINVARLYAQTFYYFYAHAMLARLGVEGQRVVYSIPCANLGNLASGLLAHTLGLPVKRFISVENENNIFYNYIKTGHFIAKPSVSSIAPALDAGNPTNMPRIMHLLGTHQQIKRMIHAYSYPDEYILSTLREVDRRYGYLMDPHSAIAWRGLCDDLREGEVGVSLATAHPAKFADTVEQAVEREVGMPAQLVRFLNGTRRVTTLNNGSNSFKHYLLSL